MGYLQRVTMVAAPAFRKSTPSVRISEERILRSAINRGEAVLDAALVRRFTDGDESAFVEIMKRHRVRMFAVSFSLLKDRTDAEEIVQDTFVHAHRGLAKFRGDSSLLTWLTRIATNLSRNRYWHFFSRRRHLTLSIDRALCAENKSTLADLLPTDGSGPAREALANEFSTIVATCMDRLQAHERQIITLRVFERSYDQIAQELRTNVGTVKSRLARARERLRALLCEACPEFGPDARPLAWFEPRRTAGRIMVATS